jgi:PAS domain S-box-containing protein
VDDIPDSKYSKTTVHESEFFARSALDSLSANIAVLNESGTIIFVNNAWREFARSNSAVKNVAEGANYLQVCESVVGDESEQAASFAEGIRSVLSGRREEFALEYPCHSPTEQRWFIGRVNRFTAGSPARVVVAHENITERKRAEEKIRFNARLLDAVGQAVIATDMEGNITYWNRFAETLYGWSAQEVLGRSIMEVTPSEDQLERAEEIMSKLRAGSSWSGEFIVRRRDGTLFPAIIIDTPVHDEQGSLVGVIGVSIDITDRKRAEEALRLRDRAIAASSNGIVITDPNQPDNPIIYVNPAFERMTGYAAQEALGRNCRFLQGTDREQPALEELRAALREDRECQVALRNYKKDGTLFWNQLSISPVRGEEGKLVNFIGVQEDVTQRKKAEEELRQSEERFRSLVRYASDIITVLGPDGTVRYQSPSIERILGYRPEELIGTNAFDYVHTEDVEQVWSVFAEALENQGVSLLVEFRFRHADGSWRFLEAVSNNLLADPSVSGMVVNSRDITERKQAERERVQLLVREQVARAEAEAAQQRLKAILDNLTEGVLVADPQGHVVFSNPAASAILGVTSGETFEELPDLWEDFHLPEAVARCARNRESIEARVSYEESHLRIKLECLINDELRNVLVVMQDLSEGHRLEANQQRFLANAAHQLRTPIMAVIGAAELLATGEDANPATRSRLLNHIFSEGRRMQRLADVLLRLSRVGWDLREPEQEVVDLREAGQRAAELMEPLVESAGLRLSIQGEAAPVHADPEWLQEVLLVLLSNAIKYSSRGGDIRLRVRGSSVTVEDEGAGISSVDLPHVFERFYRGKGSSEGFGLGLSICRELIERMGSNISVRSREGIGTVVEIELPEADLDAQDTDRRR